MMIRFRNIGLLILLLLAGRMAAQVPVLDSVCTGAVRNYRVDGEAGSTYSWILTPPAGPAIALPSDADTIQMIWNYAAGIYELRTIQHALNGCDADTVSGQVIIFEGPDVFAGPDGQVCIGRYYKLLASTASNYSSLVWTTSGDGIFDDDSILHPAYTPGANDILAGTVTLTLVGVGVLDNEGACDPSVSSMELAIVSAISPQFDPIGPLCLNSIPPALPDTSLEGITGNWTPPTITTGILGTFPFTFSPDDPAQCGVDTTIQITITDQIVPEFDPIGPLCINSPPPVLPGISLNGITGTWSPPTIDTSVPGTFTYTFTPDDTTQCGVDTTMDIAVVTKINPLFDPIGPLCQYTVPPALPDTSLNGIAGSWIPPVIDTGVPGTFTYTFIADTNQCGLDTTISIIILQQVTPVFDTIGPLCQYSASPALPDTSLNGITGTWNPAWISTAVPGIFTFIFLPDPDECADVVTMYITVLPEITPQFDPIGPLCQYVTPPALPDTSLNGISGTWSPPAITTDVLGTFFYTFTPDDSVPCTMIVTIAITILPETTPVFDSIGPLCQFSAPPALPDTSLNGTSGTWIPDTISTANTGTFTYTFTPDPGQCAVVATLDITITTEIIPEFAQIGPLCQYSVPPVLPDTSLNGITGTWDPPVINTSALGISNYIFTPDTGQCGTVVTQAIMITTELTPVFDQIGPLCLNIIAPPLPGISNNTPPISGTWDPPVINTTVPGISTYTFTPDAGQCAVAVPMDIEITDNITPVFDQIGPLCLNSIPPPLPDSSNNVPAIGGTWDPPVINTSVQGIFDYTFTPDSGQCASIVVMPIEINDEIIPVFEQIGPLCQFSPAVIMPTSSDNNPPITGTWEPPVINTAIPDTVIYTFTPDEGQCGLVMTMTVVVTGQIIPLFDPIGPLKQDTIPPALPDTSLNGITGTWDPSVIDTSIPGTYIYTFTPDTGQCAYVVTMNITVLFDILQAITGPGKHCLGDAAIVPLKVDKFTTVAEFQLKLSFNTDKLWCEGFINVNPQLGSITGWIDNLNGIITINWNSSVPLTFDSLTTVCDLIFTPKEPGQGQLAWYTGATESYFKDLAGNPIPAQFFTDDITIYQPPEIILAESKNVCEGEKVTIVGIANVTYPPVSYKWTYPNGDTTTTDPFFDSITQADAGDYTLLATDSLGCTDQKTIQLIVSENPVADFHGTDTLAVMPGYILEAGSGFDSYIWNTGETSEQITIDTTGGWYWVKIVTDVGCIGIDSVYIVLSEVPENCLYVPNAFTPNNDGLNDTFKAVSGCPDLADFKMLIFNRWGERLFESDDISIGWDGTKHGVPCPGDAYVYKISYKSGSLTGLEKEKVKVGVVVIVK